MMVKVDVLIFSPTFEELEEIRKALPNKRLDICTSSIPFAYDEGKITIKGKEYLIHVISPHKAGQRKAQSFVSEVLKVWNCKLVLLTGVAGGLHKAQIGDIILPRKVWIHDLFKKTPAGEEPRPDSVDPSEELVLLAESFFSIKNWSKKIARAYFSYLPRRDKISCFGDGNIASSVETLEKVLDDSDAIKKYKDFDGKLYGIEQEAAGVGEALKYIRIPWLDIRVVMDLADPESRSRFKDLNKQQASKVAADFSFSFLRYYFRQREKSISEDIKTKKIEFSYFNRYRFERIFNAPEPKPFRPTGPEICDFEKGFWVYIPEKAREICKKAQSGELILLTGKPATGKTVIARYIGFDSIKKSYTNVFYVDFLNLDFGNKQEVIKNFQEIVEHETDHLPKTLFIFENLHDPDLQRLDFGTKSLSNTLKILEGKIHCILTTRENLQETNDFDWIEIDNIIKLNHELELNKEIIQGILEKYRRRFPEASKDFKWEQKDAPENLWLLGCMLKVFNRPTLPKEGIRKEFKQYYKNLTSPRNARITSQHILIVLLILSVISQYETFIEKQFIKNYGIKKFPNLSEEDLEDILQLLVDIEEISLLQGLFTLRLEYRIPHSKLAQFLLNYYVDDQIKKLLNQILDDYIEHGKNVIELGYNLALVKEYEKAIECFKRGVKIKPNDYRVWVIIGVIYGKMEKHEKAIECFMKSVKIKPNDYSAWYAMGRAYARKEDYKKAIKCLTKSVKIKSDDHRSWYNLGASYDNMEEREKAFECFEKAAKIKPDYQEAWNSMGILCAHKGEHERAIDFFEKAVKIKPDYQEAWNNMGLAYAHMEEYKKTLECYEKAVKIKPDYQKAWNNMGLLYIFMGEYENALGCFSKAVKIKPNSQEMWNGMGVAYTYMEKHEKAIECFKKAVKIKPDYQEALDNIELIKLISRELNKAEEK